MVEAQSADGEGGIVDGRFRVGNLEDPALPYRIVEEKGKFFARHEPEIAQQLQVQVPHVLVGNCNRRESQADKESCVFCAGNFGTSRARTQRVGGEVAWPLGAAALRARRLGFIAFLAPDSFEGETRKRETETS